MKHEKLHHARVELLRDFLDVGYAMAASRWTTGTGRHITRRPLPPYVTEIDASQIDSLKGTAAKDARNLLRNSPRTRKILFVDDVRAANRAARS